MSDLWIHVLKGMEAHILKALPCVQGGRHNGLIDQKCFCAFVRLVARNSNMEWFNTEEVG